MLVVSEALFARIDIARVKMFFKTHISIWSNSLLLDQSGMLALFVGDVWRMSHCL